MITILKSVRTKSATARNQFMPEAKIAYMDSLLNLPHSSPGEIAFCKYLKANVLLEIGQEEEAIALLESIVGTINPYQAEKVNKDLALAYLRQGERSNCIANHASASCLLPIRGLGIHQNRSGSKRTISLIDEI